MRILLLTLVVCFAHYAFGAPQASVLPEGPGKQLVVEYCAKCHEQQRIEEAEGTKSEWTVRIRRMIRRGAVIPPEKIEPLADFLSLNLPPRVSAQSADNSPIATSVSDVSLRPIQVWIRGSGTLQNDRIKIVAVLRGDDARRIRAGDRVRAFAMSARSSMYQGKVIAVSSTSGEPTVQIQLAQPGRIAGEPYLFEIITEQETVLTIANEAIIEEGERQVVYVQRGAGDYAPREIQTGTQGELLTEVRAGLAEGERVVTFGSFFIDAEYKLKSRTASLEEQKTVKIEYRSLQPLHAGRNPIEITVTRMDGTPYTEGEIAVNYSMAAMPAMNMPEMHSHVEMRPDRKGVYTGDVALNMGGTWQVSIVVSAEGKPIGAKEFSANAK